MMKRENNLLKTKEKMLKKIKLSKQKKRYWLRGGVIGGGIGLIVSLFVINSIYYSTIYIGINNLILLFMYLLGLGFLLGALIGYFYGKIKNRGEK